MDQEGFILVDPTASQTQTGRGVQTPTIHTLVHQNEPLFQIPTIQPVVAPQPIVAPHPFVTPQPIVAPHLVFHIIMIEEEEKMMNEFLELKCNLQWIPNKLCT